MWDPSLPREQKSPARRVVPMTLSDEYPRMRQCDGGRGHHQSGVAPTSSVETPDPTCHGCNTEGGHAESPANRPSASVLPQACDDAFCTTKAGRRPMSPIAATSASRMGLRHAA